ncbi:MAG TPA: ribosome biogenesis GTP-binding protein YihA/YsxC [Chitinispirillaceae bacterium]|nr:ribosome biogenesis GTP-binding protein YihA/YsxC [Chitinispirillaceae bacterium]
MEKEKKKKAEFICSAADYRDLPALSGLEFAILGRSNVGKSSFINHVFENKSLARTSGTPGKTSLANFYRVEKDMFWVDLPGYGYAKVSGSEKQRWSRLISSYCEKRSNLTGIIWLIDIRHIGVKNDLEACQWLVRLGKPVFPVLTKADKIGKADRIVQQKKAMSVFNLTMEPVIYSVKEHSSRALFWERFEKWYRGITGEDN